MDTNRIKNLALGMRDTLRAEVSSRLDSILAEGSNARLESPGQVRGIEASISEHGREAVVDQAAYTWFNRLCALRFMDANGYTPVPVVTPRGGSTQPAILADAAQGSFDPDWDIPSSVKERVTGLLLGTIASSNPSEDAYEALLTAVCAHYAEPMGYLFGEDVASALLMPHGLLAQGSILSRIVEVLDEETCSSVEVMGWLYQFYISERKDEYFRSKKKATAADIPAATQLFTPEWIVAYLTENSLGRLWMLNNPESELSDSMDYYVAPEGDEPHIEVASADEIRVLDPACGSGHILVYAFDLLYRMYEEEGWDSEDIPEMILRNNLFGLEIDQRAAEIASFALEMKARERDSRWFEKDMDAHIKVLKPVELLPQELELVPQLAKHRGLLDAMTHLDEVGSLYVPDSLDESVLSNELEHVEHDGSLFAESAISKLRVMLANVKALNRSYHCVVANPPYMGSGNMNPWLNGWIRNNYPGEKADLCTCFINRSLRFSRQGSYASLITMHGWMFIASYEKMRMKLVSDKGIACMAHLGAHAFDAIGGEVVQTAATVFTTGPERNGTYFRLVDFDNSDSKSRALLIAVENPQCGWCYQASTDDFKVIPGTPIAYWVSKRQAHVFAAQSFGERFVSGGRNKTHDNERFVRQWWEVTSEKWISYSNGGNYRKWYGNNIDVVDWSPSAIEFYRSHGGLLREEFWSVPALTWNDITSGPASYRVKPVESIYSSSSPTLVSKDREYDYSMLGFLNSSVCEWMLRITNPTLHTLVGNVLVLPDLLSGIDVEEVVQDCVELARVDWNAFEISRGFALHPLTKTADERIGCIGDAYARWESECRNRFNRLKSNEEELNRIFARIYRMEGEVPIEVPDDKVSVRLADRARDARSLISYGIGCMFGRYSTEADGLILAGQGTTFKDFQAKVPGAAFLPDADNVLPVLSDEWFDDDAVAGIRRWLAYTYGSEALEENVAWLEESLGKDLRTYLVRDFYADHLKVYQKRPIYWMFQSPKKSFQCLVYMHRYDEGTVGTILTGYLRPLEDKLRARLQVLESPSATAADAREANKVRGMIAELEQWEREVIYPFAHERVCIDLDDGVKVNYNKFPRALAKVPGLSDWK